MIGLDSIASALTTNGEFALNGQVTRRKMSNGARSITVDTAMRLARYFGKSAAVWLRMQVRYDLKVAESELSDKINREVKVLSQTSSHA